MSEDPIDRYQVVVNDEEQYSIWPSGRSMPDGWQAVGKEGTKPECLSYVEEHWADMRPLSLRRATEADAAAADAPGSAQPAPESPAPLLTEPHSTRPGA